MRRVRLLPATEDHGSLAICDFGFLILDWIRQVSNRLNDLSSGQVMQQSLVLLDLVEIKGDIAVF